MSVKRCDTDLLAGCGLPGIYHRGICEAFKWRDHDVDQPVGPWVVSQTEFIAEGLSRPLYLASFIVGRVERPNVFGVCLFGVGWSIGIVQFRLQVRRSLQLFRRVLVSSRVVFSIVVRLLHEEEAEDESQCKQNRPPLFLGQHKKAQKIARKVSRG